MPVPKKPAKVMDAVHPTTAVASATSRPIITSRSVLKADPMLSPSDTAIGVFADEKPSGEPIPVSEGSSDSDSPLTQSVKAVAPGTVSSVVKSQVGENAENPESTPAEKSDEKTSQKTDEPNETENKQSADTSNKSTKSLETEAQDRNIDTTVSEVDDPDNTNQEKLKEAEAQPLSAQEADIERHIAAGTYAVPIDTVRRRRRTIVLITLAFLILAVVSLNILLDLDILTIPSFPHTDLL